MKLCMISSCGGHWEELMCLKSLTDAHSVCFVTEESGQTDNCTLSNLYRLPQINRQEKGFLLNFCKLFFRAGKILKKEAPQVVLTTGALISFPFCLLGKLRGAKVIYIESFARVENKSLTGKLVYPFADLFLVQWESLLPLYPKAKYVGPIF